ncbi:MAG: methylmalonyl-CoA epimerase [Gemmatimonadaceae bacterium]
MTNPTGPATRIAHVGIALAAIDAQLPFYRDVLGLVSVPVNDSDGARIVAFDADGSLVELLEPSAADSPIGRFVARRGPGIHHICFAVADLEDVMDRCRAAGIELVDQVPRIGAEGKRIAFLHPRSTGGILVELTES